MAPDLKTRVRQPASLRQLSCASWPELLFPPRPGVKGTFVPHCPSVREQVAADSSQVLCVIPASRAAAQHRFCSCGLERAQVSRVHFHELGKGREVAFTESSWEKWSSNFLPALPSVQGGELAATATFIPSPPILAKVTFG